ncbi:MAG: ABC transporter permease [Trueperaceae bacterium]|nr:ABC transporter permease [Trueperaceae bacterium]
MFKLSSIEFGKLFHLTSLRFSLIALILFPILWAYAPGIFQVYGFFIVSGYQVPALSLLSSMEFLLPLIIAVASAELLGLELAHGTLPTVLLRPVTRSQWLLAKILVAILYPFALLAFLFVVSLVTGVFYGYGSFAGGTGVGAGGLLGQGILSAGGALAELGRAYMMAAVSLIPISLLSILFTVIFMNAAGGALATLALLISMKLLIVFPGLEPYLLTTQLNAYVAPIGNLGITFALIALYAAIFAASSVILFERKDF